MCSTSSSTWLWTRAVRADRPAGDRDRRQDRPRREGQGPEGAAPGRGAAHGIGAVLGQVAADEKSNEIPAVRELLKTFADLAGTVITIDALHTQSDTAQGILDRGIPEGASEPVPTQSTASTPTR
ncbi:MAG TPA: hypothetical protein VG142_03430 [Trebonia sp.]|jgi:hypothetical protein|nr:hypothetical protein [Trebonia sp.]